MTDYELYQLLEENGYETSNENLEMLKEDDDLLYEFFFKKLTPEEKQAKKEIKLQKKAEKQAEKLEECKKKYLSLSLDEISKTIAEYIANHEAPNGKSIDYTKMNAPRYAAILRNSPRFVSKVNEFKEFVKKAERRRDIWWQYMKLDEFGEQAISDHNYLSEIRENSDYSDYELYQLLEENGYETTKDNLQILKEGLESGDIIFEKNETRVRTNQFPSPQEGMRDEVKEKMGKEIVHTLNRDDAKSPRGGGKRIRKAIDHYEDNFPREEDVSGSYSQHKDYKDAGEYRKPKFVGKPADE